MKKRTLQSAEKTPKVRIRFSEKKLTSNAGLAPIYNFIKRLGLPELLAQKLTVERGDNAVHSTEFAVLIVLFGIAAGAKHISHMIMLKADLVIRKLFGWQDFPHAATLGRIFKRFSYRNIVEFSEVESAARRRVWQKKWLGKVTLDMDSTVKGVHGHKDRGKKRV